MWAAIRVPPVIESPAAKLLSDHQIWQLALSTAETASRATKALDVRTEASGTCYGTAL